MGINQNGLLPILNKTYVVTYKNEYDQVGVFEGTLIHTGLDGFTVFSVDNKRVIIPKDRIFILQELEARAPAQIPQSPASDAVTQPGQQLAGGGGESGS